jgi:hypothetical protein
VLSAEVLTVTRGVGANGGVLKTITQRRLRHIELATWHGGRPPSGVDAIVS